MSRPRTAHVIIKLHILQLKVHDKYMTYPEL